MKLRVVSYGNQAPRDPLSAPLTPAGLSIGRGGENDLALPDAERLVSRRQARIEEDPTGSHVAINVSSSNSFLINDHELPPGQQMSLMLGDEIRMGRFVIRVENDTASAPEPRIGFVEETPLAAKPEQQIDPLQIFDAGSTPRTGPAPISASGSLEAPPPAAAPEPSALAMAPTSPNRPCSAQEDLPHRGPQSQEALDPLFGFNEQASEADPLGLGQLGAQTAQQSSGFPPLSGLPTTGGSPAAIPEDFNPFELPSASLRNTADPFAEIARTGETSLEQLVAPSHLQDDLLRDLPSFKADALAEESFEGLLGGPSSGIGSTQDPLALFDSAKPSQPSILQPQGQGAMHNHTPEIHSAFSVPEARPSEPIARPIARPTEAENSIADVGAAPITPPTVLSRAATPDPGRCTESPGPVEQSKGDAPSACVSPSTATGSMSAPRSDSDGTALMTAFMAGAGLSDIPLPPMSEQFMNQLGQLLATATQGTVDLIQARAATKHELRAEVTIIAPRANNPLKFAPDGHSAMNQLVGHRFPGFMPPVEAMQDAFNDLRAHQLGMTAGMRAALHDVLLRFSPEHIESRLTQRSILDSVLPQNRKSQLWKLYTGMFEQIMDEAENEFHSLFGKAFLEAYDQETSRLSQKEGK